MAPASKKSTTNRASAGGDRATTWQQVKNAFSSKPSKKRQRDPTTNGNGTGDTDENGQAARTSKRFKLSDNKYEERQAARKTRQTTTKRTISRKKSTEEQPIAQSVPAKKATKKRATKVVKAKPKPMTMFKNKPPATVRTISSMKTFSSRQSLDGIAFEFLIWLRADTQQTIKGPKAVKAVPPLIVHTTWTPFCQDDLDDQGSTRSWDMYSQRMPSPSDFAEIVSERIALWLDDEGLV